MKIQENPTTDPALPACLHAGTKVGGALAAWEGALRVAGPAALRAGQPLLSRAVCAWAAVRAVADGLGGGPAAAAAAASERARAAALAFRDRRPPLMREWREAGGASAAMPNQTEAVLHGEASLQARPSRERD